MNSDGNPSTCVDPDQSDLITSVSHILTTRMRDNEEAEQKTFLPLFCEDTHTDEPVENRYSVQVPAMHLQAMPITALFRLVLLPPLKKIEPSFAVPDEAEVREFIEDIWFKAKLTPQSLVICLIYVDRLESKSESVILHARSWRPIVFSSLLLASKVWHDVSYWNSDFSNICPMFHTKNINQMERAFLQLLQYNTIISSSQYASYYFSLRAASHAYHSKELGRARSRNSPVALRESRSLSLKPDADTTSSTYKMTASSVHGNFRSKYYMSLHVSGSSKLEQQTASAIKGSTRVIPFVAKSLGKGLSGGEGHSAHWGAGNEFSTRGHEDMASSL